MLLRNGIAGFTYLRTLLQEFLNMVKFLITQTHRLVNPDFAAPFSTGLVEACLFSSQISEATCRTYDECSILIYIYKHLYIQIYTYLYNATSSTCCVGKHLGFPALYYGCQRC